MNILTKPHADGPNEDGSKRTELDWNKLVDLAIKVVGLLTLVYCVKHGINTDSKVATVEHKAVTAEAKAEVAAATVQSNTVEVAAQKVVLEEMHGKEYVAETIEKAVNVANQGSK